jgi:hypothetical protein
MNKTAHVDAEHILDAYRAQQVGTVVCVKSFGYYDPYTGAGIMRAGQSYLAADQPIVQRFPENFVMEGTGDAVPIPGIEPRSDSPSAPDLSGLLVCTHAFQFIDPDSGYPRSVRYGHDFVEPGSWLDEHYGENFVRVKEVVPSDRIPHLPYRDE